MQCSAVQCQATVTHKIVRKFASKIKNNIICIIKAEYMLYKEETNFEGETESSTIVDSSSKSPSKPSLPLLYKKEIFDNYLHNAK